MSVEISIIVPIYNVEKYLTTCIKSVLAQSFKNFELILINDKSPDHSQGIISAYGSKDSRIVSIVNAHNMGQGMSRNVGVDKAKGKYIYFLDSDDFLHPTALQVLYDKISEYKANGHNLDMVIGGAIKVEDTQYDSNAIERIASKNPTDKTSQYKKEEFLDNTNTIIDRCKTYPEQQGILPSVWNRLYRISFLKESKVIFPQDCIGVEDLEYTPKLLSHAKKILLVKESLYYYRQRDNSLSSDKNIDLAHLTQTVKNLMLVINNLRDYFLKQGVFEQYQSLLEHMFATNVFNTVYNNNIPQDIRRPLFALFLGILTTESTHSHSIFDAHKFFMYNSHMPANVDNNSIARWLFFSTQSFPKKCYYILRWTIRYLLKILHIKR